MEQQEYIMIAGGSSGIGEDVARYLHSQGNHVVLIGRNTENLQKICKELGQDNYYFSYDLVNVEGIESIFNECKSKGIKFEGLVYAAGISDMVPIKVNDIRNTQRMLDINSNAFLEMGRCFCKKKYSNSGSKIVVISSIEAVLKEKGYVSYSGSKSLLETYAMVLAKEYVTRNICVNVIRPANVRTPMYEKAIKNNTELEDNLLKRQPLGIIKTRQISYMVNFLLSEKARFITGSRIDISAGWNI